MFKQGVSTYKAFDSDPVSMPLMQWLQSCRNPKSKYAKQVREYRQTGDKELKTSLPLVTVGALCQGGRKLEDVTERTGWVALDIDAKDNPHLDNFEQVRDTVAKIVFVAFAALSVSGKGVWALVKVKDPDKQARYFEQLKQDFEQRGIILDPTKGKNPNDARFYSYDPNAYLADDFKVYDRLPKVTRKPAKEFKYYGKNNNDTQGNVEALIAKIQSQRIDITAGYQIWRDLGFALEDEFGERGRDYYHIISQYHKSYDFDETDRQYDRCLKSNGQGVTIATFFHICKEYGIQN